MEGNTIATARIVKAVLCKLLRQDGYAVESSGTLTSDAIRQAATVAAA